MLAQVHMAGPTDYGSLAPLVFEAAAAGDALAQRLRAEAVDALLASLWTLERRYGSGQTASFSMVGSIAEVVSAKLLARAPRRFREGYWPGRSWARSSWPGKTSSASPSSLWAP
ncbi:MAG: hypothetical protein M3511_02540 [Deinococcota bacterium]|nr:hypothetical protein [Deinococcota bacterium]